MTAAGTRIRLLQVSEDVLEDKAFKLLDIKNGLAYPHADNTEPKRGAVLKPRRAVTHDINNVKLWLYYCC